jgi:tetratricopeptide (TPR) repeat protein
MDLVQRYRLAQDYLDDGAPLAAVETLRPVEAELTETASGQLLLARAYYHSAQLTRAERAFARVVELNPADDYARFALGRTLERQSRPGEAMAHYRVAVALSPRPEYLERLAALHDRRCAGST